MRNDQSGETINAHSIVFVTYFPTGGVEKKCESSDISDRREGEMTVKDDR